MLGVEHLGRVLGHSQPFPRRPAVGDRVHLARASNPTGASPISTPVAASGAGFVLRSAPDARGCTPPRQVPDARAPAMVAETLRILRLPRTSVDGLPVLNRTDGQSSADTGWLAARTIDHNAVRRHRHLGSVTAIYTSYPPHASWSSLASASGRRARRRCEPRCPLAHAWSRAGPEGLSQSDAGRSPRSITAAH
jgi:hypothetical protein